MNVIKFDIFGELLFSLLQPKLQHAQEVRMNITRHRRGKIVHMSCDLTCVTIRDIKQSEVSDLSTGVTRL